MRLGYFPLLPYSHVTFIAKKQDDFLPSWHGSTCTSVQQTYFHHLHKALQKLCFKCWRKVQLYAVSCKKLGYNTVRRSERFLQGKEHQLLNKTQPRGMDAVTWPAMHTSPCLVHLYPSSKLCKKEQNDDWSGVYSCHLFPVTTGCTGLDLNVEDPCTVTKLTAFSFLPQDTSKDEGN